MRRGTGVAKPCQAYRPKKNNKNKNKKSIWSSKTWTGFVGAHLTVGHKESENCLREHVGLVVLVGDGVGREFMSATGLLAVMFIREKFYLLCYF